MFRGKKTFAIGIATALYGVLGVVLGKHDTSTAIQLILNGGGLVTLRQALTNELSK